jgi:hypothetical protein
MSDRKRVKKKRNSLICSVSDFPARKKINLTISDIQIHLDSENISKTVRLRCHLCGWDFFDKSTKNRHLRRTHGLDREEREKIESLLRNIKKSCPRPCKAEASKPKEIPTSNPKEIPISKPKTSRKRCHPLSDDDTLILSAESAAPLQPALHHLPLDALVLILARLRVRPLLHISATCRALADSIRAGALWRRLLLAHCDPPSAAASLHELSMPEPIWRGLYRAMYLAHVAARRRRRRSDQPNPRRRGKSPASAAPPAAEWRCPAHGCGAAFRTQERLHAHVARHFPPGGRHKPRRAAARADS